MSNSVISKKEQDKSLSSLPYCILTQQSAFLMEDEHTVRYKAHSAFQQENVNVHTFCGNVILSIVTLLQQLVMNEWYSINMMTGACMLLYCT